MANTIALACPKCKKQMAVPANLAGKKIRCKDCQTVIDVKESAHSAQSTPESRRKQVDRDFDDDNKNPYVMITENLAARCPFCALPMDPPDSRICLHCGYDMQKRKRHDKTLTIEHTFGDYFVWHLSTIAAFCTLNFLIGLNIFLGVNMKAWWEGAWFDGIVRFEACTVWNVILSCWPAWACARLIFRKLVYNFKPPEKIQRDIDDEE